MARKVTEKAEGSEITITASGDTMISKRLSPYEDERFLSLVDIMRHADVSYTNCETTFHEKGKYYLANPILSGTAMGAEPYMADELKWAGINMVSFSMSHSMDYGVGGMFDSMANLDRVGIVHAGTGKNLVEAREPRYLETAKGRIAIISVCSEHTGWKVASDGKGSIPERPGCNAIPFENQFLVSRASLEALKKIKAELKTDVGYIHGRLVDKERTIADDELEFPGHRNVAGEQTMRFKVGEKPGIVRTYNKSASEGNLRSINDAKKFADWVLFAFHGAELPETGLEYPADHYIKFAHDCIDAGADAFLGSGPHIVRGVEIYKGKPIFYSLGNFIAQNVTMKRVSVEQYRFQHLDETRAMPSEFYERRYGINPWGRPPYDRMWFESVLAAFTLKGGKLTELKLHPLDLGFGKPWSQIGRPVLADERQGKTIVEWINKISRPFGTKFQFSNGVGIARL